MNPIDQILDPNNTAPIKLFDADDNPVLFEQIALIELDNESYVLLHPIDKMEDVEDDEAIVFVIKTQGSEQFLEIVDDDDIVDEVFEEYYALLAEEGIV